MRAEDQTENEDKRSRRKRKAKAVARVASLIAACIFLPIFLTAIAVGYLSWIGILVGIIYLAPGIVSPVAGFAGKKRLEGLLGWLSGGMPILLALAVSVAAIWPVDDGKQWRPYRFDDEFAALEAERAIPDQENAAIRCAPLFAKLDVNDRPDFFFRAGRVRDEFSKNPWNGAKHPQAAQWLDGYSWVVDELVQARAAGPFRWSLQADRYDDYTVPYEALRRSIDLLMVSANRDFGEDRLHNAIAKYACTIRITHDLRQQTQPVDVLAGLGLEKDALPMICHVLVRYGLSDEDITLITGCLPSTNDLWPEMCEQLFRLEKLQYVNLLARAYERNEQGRVRFARWYSPTAKNEQLAEEDQHLGRWLLVYWPMNMPRDPKRLHRMADHDFGQFTCLLEADGAPPLIHEERMSWTNMCKVAANFHRWLAEIIFFDGSEYAMIRCLQRAQVTRRRGTWLVVGLRRYRDKHGSWPKSLDAIVEYVPAEAFLDPTSGAHFVYALEGDDFTLYSIGLNRTDDGGRHRYVKAQDKLEDDIAIWPPHVPEPPREESSETMIKELKAIYGEEYVRRLQTDVNAP